MAPKTKRRNTSVARVRAPIASSAASSKARRAKNAAPATTVRDWRRKARRELLRAAVAATGSLGWSQTLLNLLFDELYVADALEGLIGCRVRELPERQYPQAIALALVLRHSWCPDDLASVLKRLGVLRPPRPSRPG